MDYVDLDKLFHAITIDESLSTQNLMIEDPLMTLEDHNSSGFKSIDLEYVHFLNDLVEEDGEGTSNGK
jgi:hypothetical protein